MNLTRLRGLALALTAAFLLSSPPASAAAAGESDAALIEQIRKHRAETWRWQRLMGKRRSPTSYAELTASTARRIAIRDVWRARADRVRRLARRPPHLVAWRCIHRYEGPWRDPGAPYYGGLQMDITFQRMYGLGLLRRRGTANRWTPREQMWVAERALRAGRGFYPWPVAARRCGLI